MASKKLNTIIIDPHPLLIQVYRNILEELEASNKGLHFKIDDASSCDMAMMFLERMYATKQEIDLVLLDIRIPPTQKTTNLIGIDLGAEIRTRYPKAKIVVNAAYNNSYHTSTILITINPEGFLIKTDVTLEILKQAIMDALFNPPYYSKSVLKWVQKSGTHDISLDKWDRRLLYELSQGVKMKDLPKILPFSLAAIEKRKRHIKQLFDISGANDSHLLLRAREYGFI